MTYRSFRSFDVEATGDHDDHALADEMTTMMRPKTVNRNFGKRVFVAKNLMTIPGLAVEDPIGIQTDPFIRLIVVFPDFLANTFTFRFDVQLIDPRMQDRFAQNVDRAGQMSSIAFHPEHERRLVGEGVVLSGEGICFADELGPGCDFPARPETDMFEEMRPTEASTKMRIVILAAAVDPDDNRNGRIRPVEENDVEAVVQLELFHGILLMRRGF